MSTSLDGEDETPLFLTFSLFFFYAGPEPAKLLDLQMAFTFIGRRTLFWRKDWEISRILFFRWHLQIKIYTY